MDDVHLGHSGVPLVFGSEALELKMTVNQQGGPQFLGHRVGVWVVWQSAGLAEPVTCKHMPDGTTKK